MLAGLAFDRSDRGTILPSIGSGIVLTRRSRPRRREVPSTQTLGPGLRERGGHRQSTYVIHRPSKATEPTPQRSRQKRGKVRGRRSRSCLVWSEVLLVHEIDHDLVAAGHERAFLVTIRGEGVTDSKRKRAIHDRRGHICQSIKRGGLPFLAQTVFEKPIGGQLHAHILVYGPPRRLAPRLAQHGEMDMRIGAQSREIGAEVHIRPAVASDPAYITKQRRWDGPEIEATRQHRRVGGAAIPGGLLVKPTGDVLQALADWQERKAPAPKVERFRTGSAAPERTGRIQAPPMVPIIEDAAGQLGFVLGEPDNLVIRLDEWRKAQGARQEDVAAAMGISRPTFANALAGRYRLSGWAMSRAAELLRAS